MRFRSVADLLIDGLVVLLLVIGLVLTLAVIATPLLGPPADALKEAPVSPPWYFAPFYAVVGLLSVGWGSLVVIALFLLVLLVPWLDRSQPGSSRLLPLVVGLIVIAAVVWLGVQGASGEETQCMTCHSEIKVDYLLSEHARFDVTCVACHGGDPVTLELDRAHDPEAGFRGTPSRESIPPLCASCHSNPDRMKPFDLPTDQYAQYLTSRHGERWIGGDMNVAICTDCHGSHRILPPFDPRSAVNPMNIPSTCGNCHSDAQLMERYGLPSDQVTSFERSVHGTALLGEGHANAPSCAGCHGSHGAMPPGVEAVSKVCGNCHSKTRSFFGSGPHKRAMDQQKISECVSCHGSHSIEPVGLDGDLGWLFETSCSQCHAQDSEAMETGQKLKTLLVHAQQTVENARGSLERAASRGFDVEPYRSRMLEARAYLVQALPVQHSLDVDQVEELTRRTRSIAESVRSQVHGLLGIQGVRLMGLALIWAYLVLVLIVVLLFRRERGRR